MNPPMAWPEERLLRLAMDVPLPCDVAQAVDRWLTRTMIAQGDRFPAHRSLVIRGRDAP